jgi:hypothetical protein
MYPYYYVSYHTYVARYVRMYVVTYVPTYVSTYVMYESLLIMMYYKKEFQSSPYLEESLEAEPFPFLKVGSHNATSRISWYKILYQGTECSTGISLSFFVDLSSVFIARICFPT